MAIVELDKVTLYGSQGQKKAALEGLQRLGCLHLTDLTPERRPPSPTELISKEAREALQFLRDCPDRRRQATIRKDYDLEQTQAEALKIKRRQEELEDERDHLNKAIRDLQPWGDFRAPAAEDVGGLRLWPYVLPHHALSALNDRHYAWEVVARDEEHEYVMVLSADRPEGVPGTPAELAPQPRSELQSYLEEVEEELDELHWQRVALTRWCTILKKDLDEADDAAAREAATHRMLESGELFAIQAWTPHVALPDISSLAEDQGLAITVEPADANETPPTLLKNPERVAGAEGAVTFYITPDYHTWDPTIVVYFSFSLFFGMICADAGYALIFAALLLLFWKRLSGSRTLRRFRDMLAALVVATFAYGAVMGSYFGLPAPPGLSWLKIMDFGDQGTMMGLSILIGVAHLSLANLITAWRHRESLRCISSIGWATLMVGGFALGAAVMGGAPGADGLTRLLGITTEQLFGAMQSFGIALLILGGLAVLLFSGERPFFPVTFGNVFGRLYDGVSQVTKISKAFGDVLSYLRLFALGLASAQLASTFNGLAQRAAEHAGLGFLLAVLIIVVGHGINILLAIMSGVVHGLRLNCIEFFDWSLNEEGYSFQAFRKKAESSWITS